MTRKLVELSECQINEYPFKAYNRELTTKVTRDGKKHTISFSQSNGVVTPADMSDSVGHNLRCHMHFLTDIAHRTTSGLLERLSVPVSAGVHMPSLFDSLSFPNMKLIYLSL